MDNAFFKQFSIAAWMLFFGLFLGTNSVNAQSCTVSVDFKNATIKEIFENLETRNPYRFVYKSDIDLSKQRITMKKAEVLIDKFLNNLQALTKLNLRKNKNNIAVNKKY